MTYVPTMNHGLRKTSWKARLLRMATPAAMAVLLSGCIIFDLDGGSPGPGTGSGTDMGSGQFASEGFGKAAYFRNPTYIDPSGASQWADGLKSASPTNDACYTRTPLLSGAAPWDRYFYVGGPGGLGLDGGSLNCHGLP